MAFLLRIFMEAHPSILRASSSMEEEISDSLRAFFDEWMELAPLRDAVVYADGAISRKDLYTSVLCINNSLRSVAEPGLNTNVSLCLESGYQNLALGLALFLSGFCQSVLPRHAAKDELSASLLLIPPDLLITDAARPPWLDDSFYLAGKLKSHDLDDLYFWKPVGRCARVAASRLARRTSLQDSAFITHSSGTTTGVPTPSRRSFHRTLSYALSGKKWPYYTDRRLVENNLQHSAPRAQLITHLLAGGTLCVYNKKSLHCLGKIYGDFFATRFHSNPFALRQIAKPDTAAAFPSDARFLTGTDRVPQSLRQEMNTSFPNALDIFYSTSQVGPITHLPSPAILEVPESVGFALEGVVINAVENSVSLDQPFEVAINKDWPIAYECQDGIRRVIIDGCRTFRPGDMLRCSKGGHYVFCGRADDVFLFRGGLIYPSELENFLESFAEVQEAVVFGALSSAYGAVPMGLIRLQQDVDADIFSKELIRKSRQLFGYRGLYALHINDEIPRNASLKPLRHKLAKRYRLS